MHNELINKHNELIETHNGFDDGWMDEWNGRS